MLNDFLEHTCNIIEVSLGAMSGGEQSKTEDILKSDVECKLYKARRHISNSISETTDSIRYECIMEYVGILVQEGFRLDINDPDVGSLGKYRVLTQGIPKRDINGEIDHITVTIEKWQ